MFSIQIKSLATIHIQQVTAAYNSRGKGRQLRIASLYPDLIDQLENMAEACEYEISQRDTRAERTLEKVQENMLQAHGDLADLKEAHSELQSQHEETKRQMSWKDTELLRLIEEMSELKQIVAEYDDKAYREEES